MNIFPFLVLLFIGVPMLEIYLLIEVGGVIGGLNTVLLVLFTAVLGVGLIRLQGFSTLQKAQGMMQQGQLPALEMFEGVALFFAAVMLLTPGFFTDSLGFLMLIPPLRRALIKNVLRRGTVTYMHRHGYDEGNTYQASGDDYEVYRRREQIRHTHVIEGEVVDKDKDQKD